MLSFHGWKVLSKALHTEEDATLGMFHYSKSIGSPDSPLQVYTKPLTSKTYDFVTSLSINFACTVVELVQLAKIPNLGILEILNPEPRGKTLSSVGDIVLKAWGREADRNGAFSVLRILRLWNHENLTEKSIHHIHSFPALALFDVRDCGINNSHKMVVEAKKLGWVATHNTNLMKMLEEKCESKRKKVSAGSPLRSQSAESGFMKALWSGSKVHRMERSKVHSFYAQSETGCDNCPSTDSQPFNSGQIWPTKYSPSDIAASRWPDYVKEVAEGEEEWVSLSWDIFCNTDTRDMQPWESSYATCWAKIGEVREDQDLILAGVKGVEKQTFVGPHLVSPVPMAYIRLGEVHQCWRLRSTTSTRHVPKSLEKLTSFEDGLIFIRIDMHPRSAPASQLAIDSQLDEAVSGKRKVGGLGRMRSLKKQKLDDVLNGFKAG